MKNNFPIKAVILAAGRGERLKPLTNNIPKCLLPIGNKPLLRYWIDELLRIGITEILINTHWLSNIVNDYVCDINNQLNINIRIFHESSLLGSAGTLAANSSWLRKSSCVLVIYADNFSKIDLSKILQSHFEASSDLTLGTFITSEPERCGIVNIDMSGRITSFIEKPLFSDSNLAASGIYVMSPNKILKLSSMYNDRNKPFDLGTDFFPKEAIGEKIFPINEPIIDIGTINSYNKVRKKYGY